LRAGQTGSSGEEKGGRWGQKGDKKKKALGTSNMTGDVEKSRPYHGTVKINGEGMNAASRRKAGGEGAWRGARTEQKWITTGTGRWKLRGGVEWVWTDRKRK